MDDESASARDTGQAYERVRTFLEEFGDGQITVAELEKLEGVPPLYARDLEILLTGQFGRLPGVPPRDAVTRAADDLGKYLTEHGVDVAQVAKREMRDEPEGYVRTHYVGDFCPGGHR